MKWKKYWIRGNSEGSVGIWYNKRSTWQKKILENQGNQNLVEIFEEEYREGLKQARKEDCEEFCRDKLPRRFIAKILYRWDHKRFN